MRPVIVSLCVALTGLATSAAAQHQNNVQPPKVAPVVDACKAKTSTIYKETIFNKSSPAAQKICVGKCEAVLRGVQWVGEKGTFAYAYTGKSCG